MRPVAARSLGRGLGAATWARTSDRHIFIEAWREGYVRYCDTTTGERWEVRGVCQRLGNCLIGTVIGGELVRDHAHLERVARRMAKARGPGWYERPDFGPGVDVPVRPGFSGCCPFEFEVL